MGRPLGWFLYFWKQLTFIIASLSSVRLLRPFVNPSLTRTQMHCQICFTASLPTNPQFRHLKKWTSQGSFPFKNCCSKQNKSPRPKQLDVRRGGAVFCRLWQIIPQEHHMNPYAYTHHPLTFNRKLLWFFVKEIALWQLLSQWAGLSVTSVSVPLSLYPVYHVHCLCLFNPYFWLYPINVDFNYQSKRWDRNTQFNSKSEMFN